MTRPLYIFDLDGTLALTGHRQHYIEGKVQDWDGYFDACDGDPPNAAVIATLLLLHKSGASIWIMTGRSDRVSQKTASWLRRYGIMPCVEFMQMRPADDQTPDQDLKMRWLAGMQPRDRNRLVAVFDDRDSVVSTWRAAGVPCFQVARGKF